MLISTILQHIKCNFIPTKKKKCSEPLWMGHSVYSSMTKRNSILVLFVRREKQTKVSGRSSVSDAQEHCREKQAQETGQWGCVGEKLWGDATFVWSPVDLSEGLAGAWGRTFQTSGRVSTQVLRDVWACWGTQGGPARGWKLACVTSKPSAGGAPDLATCCGSWGCPRPGYPLWEPHSSLRVPHSSLLDMSQPDQ